MQNINTITFPSSNTFGLATNGDLFFNKQRIIDKLSEIEITSILDNTYDFLLKSVKELAIYEFDYNRTTPFADIYYTEDDFFEYCCGWSRFIDEGFLLEAYMVVGNKSCIFSQYEITDQFGFEAAKRALIKDLNESMKILEDAFYG